jgi:alpha-beta hydrolase superfamily lysophospholipase
MSILLQLEVLEHTPDSDAKPTPVLFVHGAWHGAWCWDRYFLPYFAQHGYASYALSLRGHGQSAANKGMIRNGVWDYVTDVAQVAAQIVAQTGERPVVVGHSMGGYITLKYLEKHTAPAVILLASLPVMGMLPFQLRLIRRQFFATLKCLRTMSAYPIVEQIDDVRRLFFSDTIPAEDLKTCHAQLQNESLRILLDAGFLHLPKPKQANSAPMLVIAAQDDTIFTIEEEQKTAAAYGTSAVVIPHIAHDVMLEDEWQTVADHIITWLEARGF